MKVIVITEHVSNYPNPIHFQQGDRLILGALDSEYPGWMRVATEDGNQGWAPVHYIDVVTDSLAVANIEYHARELNTKMHEVLWVLDEINGWYQVKNKAGVIGWVPAQTVRLV